MSESELFEEVKTELLEEGLLAFMDSKCKKIPTCIRLNPETFYLEWPEDGVQKGIYMSYFLFHNRVDDNGRKIIGLEINSVGPNQFLPIKQEFFFTSEQTRRKLEVFLEHSREMIRQMTYTNDLLDMYQHREFNNLLPESDPDAEKVDKNHVKKYFKNVGLRIKVERNNFKFEDWKKLYVDKLAEQTSASLRTVFTKFSTWIGENEDRLMTEANLADFLEKHQRESRSELSVMMKRHMGKVSSFSEAVCC